MSEDPNILVEEALSGDLRIRLLQNAFAQNPGLRGAKVADVIDIYRDHDSFLWATEDWWEDHGGELADEIGKQTEANLPTVLGILASSAMAACLILSGAGSIETNIALLTERIARAAAAEERGTVQWTTP